MTEARHERSRSTAAGSAAIESNRRSHDALADAQAHLYAALAAAQSGRERAWAARVARALSAARSAIDRHADEVSSTSGIYEELRMDAPWLAGRIERLERQLLRLSEQAADLAEKLSAMEDGVQAEAQGIRAEAERMLSSLRDLVVQENELVFERWVDPPALD